MPPTMRPEGIGAGTLGTLIIQLENNLGNMAEIELVKGSVNGGQTFDLKGIGRNIIFYTGDGPPTPKNSGVRKQTRPPKPSRPGGSHPAKPAELIEALPKALRQDAEKTWKKFTESKRIYREFKRQEKLHLESKKGVKEGQLNLLKKMKSRLPNANVREKKAIGNFLQSMFRMSEAIRTSSRAPTGDLKVVIDKRINQLQKDISKITKSSTRNARTPN